MILLFTSHSKIYTFLTALIIMLLINNTVALLYYFPFLQSDIKPDIFSITKDNKLILIIKPSKLYNVPPYLLDEDQGQPKITACVRSHGNGNPLQYSSRRVLWTEEPGRLYPQGHRGSDTPEHPHTGSHGKRVVFAGES